MNSRFQKVTLPCLNLAKTFRMLCKSYDKNELYIKQHIKEKETKIVHSKQGTGRQNKEKIPIFYTLNHYPQ